MSLTFEQVRNWRTDADTNGYIMALEVDWSDYKAGYDTRHLPWNTWHSKPTRKILFQIMADMRRWQKSDQRDSKTFRKTLQVLREVRSIQKGVTTYKTVNRIIFKMDCYARHIEARVAVLKEECAGKGFTDDGGEYHFTRYWNRCKERPTMDKLH